MDGEHTLPGRARKETQHVSLFSMNDGSTVASSHRLSLSPAHLNRPVFFPSCFASYCRAAPTRRSHPHPRPVCAAACCEVPPHFDARVRPRTHHFPSLFLSRCFLSPPIARPGAGMHDRELALDPRAWQVHRALGMFVFLFPLRHTASVEPPSHYLINERACERPELSLLWIIFPSRRPSLPVLPTGTRAVKNTSPRHPAGAVTPRSGCCVAG